jgi:hypothetical protein
MAREFRLLLLRLKNNKVGMQCLRESVVYGLLELVRAIHVHNTTVGDPPLMTTASRRRNEGLSETPLSRQHT